MSFFDVLNKKKKEVTTPKKEAVVVNAKKAVASKKETKEISGSKKSNKRIPHVLSQVIKYPMMSEKAVALGDNNQYVFVVDAHASKHQVEQAVAAVYGVDVYRVRMVNLPRKKRTRRGITGFTAKKRKAIVTLQPGESISLYESI